MKTHRDQIKFGISTEKRPKVENKFVGITEPHVWGEVNSSEFPNSYFLRNQNGSSMCGAMGPAEVIDFQTGIVVSAQPFYSRRPNKPDEGMSLDYILAIPCTEGTCLESQLPSNNLTEQEADAPVLVPTPITGSLPVELNIDDIEELASACDQYGGIVVTVNVAWEEWNSEQGVPAYIPTAEVAGGHCLSCLKGIIYNGVRGMLCKNSWGNDDDSINNSSWIFLSEDFLKHRGTGAGAFVKPTNLMEPVDANQTLVKWCNAIQEYEGWTENPPSRSFRNNNPGNLNFIGQANAVLETPEFGEIPRFAHFDSYGDGYQCLYNMLLNDCLGKSEIYKPTMTLLEYYNLYAPSYDGNDVNAYAENIAQALGVTVDTIIGSFV